MAGTAHACRTRGQSPPAAASLPRLALEVATELARQPAGAPAQPQAVAAAASSAVLAAAAGKHAALPGSSQQAPPSLTAAGKSSTPTVQTGTATGLSMAAVAGPGSGRLLQQVAPKASVKVSGQSAPQQCGPRGARPAPWRWLQKRLSRTMSAISGVRVMPPGSTRRSLPSTAQRATDRKPRATRGDPCGTRGTPYAQRVCQLGAKIEGPAGLGAGAVGSTGAAGAGPCARTAAEAGSVTAGAGQADGSAAEAGPAGAAAAEAGQARGAAEAGHASGTAVPGASCAACSEGAPKAGSTGFLPARRAGIGGSSAPVRISSVAGNQAADKSDIMGPVNDRTECPQRIPGLISGCDSSELMCGESLTSQSSLCAAGCPPGSSKHAAAAVDAADPAPQKQAGAAELRLAPGASSPEPAAVHAQEAAPQKQAAPAELRCPSPAVGAVVVQTAVDLHMHTSAAGHAADATPQQQAAPAQLTELRCPSPTVAVQPAAVVVQTAADLHRQASAAAHAADAAHEPQAGPAESSGGRPADSAKPLDVEVKANNKFGNGARAAAAWQALAWSKKGLETPAAAFIHKAGRAVPLELGGSLHGELS